MPSAIALLICIIFIFYVFILDYRRESNVSVALWIPLIWMIIIGSRNASHWLNLGTVMSTEAFLKGSPFDRNVFSLLIIAGLFILIRRKIYWSQIIKENAWIVLFFLYCGISIFWSDFLGVAFKRYIKGIGNIIMVLVVLTDPDPIEALKTMIRRCAYLLIPLSILFYKYYPQLGRQYHRFSGELMITGVTTNKNSLGALCLVCSIFFFWYTVLRWRDKDAFSDNKDLYIHILILIMISWLLIKADSATSTGCAIIAICTYVGLELPIIKNNIKYIGIVISIIAFVFIFLQLSVDILQSSVTILGRNMTFTDRTLIWKDIIGMSTSSLLGTGYDSFWLGDRLERLWAEYWWRPTEAHNGYIETYLELGLVGLLLLIGVIFSVYKNVRRTLMVDFEYGRFRMIFLVIAIVYNFMESAFKGTHIIWFLFLLIAVECPRPKANSDISRNIHNKRQFLL